MHTHKTNQDLFSTTPCKHKKAPSTIYQNLTVQESTQENQSHTCATYMKLVSPNEHVHVVKYMPLFLYNNANSSTKLETRYDLSTSRYPCYIHNVHSSPSTLTPQVGLFLYNVCDNTLSYIQWRYYLFIMYTYSHKTRSLLCARELQWQLVRQHDSCM